MSNSPTFCTSIRTPIGIRANTPSLSLLSDKPAANPLLPMTPQGKDFPIDSLPTPMVFDHARSG